MILIDNNLVKFGTFPNGERNLNFNKVCFASNSTVLLKFESDQDLMDLFILKSYIDECMPDNKVKLYITYMPYSRMDRANAVYTFNLKYISNLINSMNFYQVTVLEPHSDVCTALLNRVKADSVISNLFNIFMRDINSTFVVMYPDAGAEKRYSHTFCYSTVVGMKSRDFLTGTISSYQIMGADVKDCDVVIIDDLCSRGGTFVEAAKALKMKGAKNIYLIVTHCENNVFTGELFDHITKMYTTNSLLIPDFTKPNMTQINLLNVYEVNNND